MSVLGGHPTFKCREEQIGRYASKHPAQKQQLEVGAVLQNVDDDFQNAVDDAGFLPAKLINRRSQEGGKDCTTQEAGEEQRRDVDPIREVQRVHVSALHPVCQHYNEIDGNVLPTEGIELRVKLLRGGFGPCGSALCDLQILLILRRVQYVGTDKCHGKDSAHDH